VTSDSSWSSSIGDLVAPRLLEPRRQTPDKPSRIGLLLEDFLQPAWACASVERLLRDPDVRVALVVLAPPPCSVLQHQGSSLRQIAGHGPVKALEMLDKRLRARAPDPFAARVLKPLLEGIPTMTTELHDSDGGWQMPAKDVQTICDARPDALLYFGEERTFCGGILSATPHGLWLFRHGSAPPYKGARSGFWETIAREVTATATLVAMTDDGTEELCRSVIAADRISPARTRSTLYWTSTSFPVRALKRVREAASLHPSRSREPSPQGESWTRGTPARSANRTLVRCLPSFLARVGRDYAQAHLGHNQWFLGYTWADESIVPSFLGKAGRIVPPGDRLWADPHVISRGSEYFVFVEELLFSEKRGRIAVLIMDRSGMTGGPITVLDQPYHLSYPFVFEHEDVLYMIPETAEHQTIELYRCVEFPAKWEFVRTLMQNVTALDTTLLFHNGRWWLFTSMCETQGASRDSELYLFSSDDPLSRSWLPHPRNPIVSDARRARPAGRIFERHGKLLRPSQQTAPVYGYAVHINEILTLTDEEYAESECGCLLPDWQAGLVGTHTLSRAAELTIVDGCQWRPRWITSNADGTLKRAAFAGLTHRHAGVDHQAAACD